MEAPAHDSAWGPVAVNTASFIDYPGMVSTVLFMPGCNLRCPYCQNADIVTYSDRGQSTGLRRHGREEVEAILDGGIGVIETDFHKEMHRIIGREQQHCRPHYA